jgi:FAD/FMN-containing dehydrogenase
MTAIDSTARTRSHEPGRVADAFVLELRTHTARSPALPVRPLTAAEVAVAVRYGLDEEIEVPLDLSRMKRAVIDADACTARIQPGVTTAELERIAFYWGLAPLVDAYGLAAANLIAARVVLPDGELVDADAALLRRLRAGDAVGIVVDATYRLHPLADLAR